MLQDTAHLGVQPDNLLSYPHISLISASLKFRNSRPLIQWTAVLFKQQVRQATMASELRQNSTETHTAKLQRFSRSQSIISSVVIDSKSLSEDFSDSSAIISWLKLSPYEHSWTRTRPICDVRWQSRLFCVHAHNEGQMMAKCTCAAMCFLLRPFVSGWVIWGNFIKMSQLFLFNVDTRVVERSRFQIISNIISNLLILVPVFGCITTFCSFECKVHTFG